MLKNNILTLEQGSCAARKMGSNVELFHRYEVTSFGAILGYFTDTSIQVHPY